MNCTAIEVLGILITHTLNPCFLSSTNVYWTHTAAAAAKSLQSCPTLCDPVDGSPPGSPSLGFSKQEHWSGLPFPSPMHESEKWKWSRSVVSDSSRPHGLQPTRLLCPWDFPGKSTGVGCHCLGSTKKTIILWQRYVPDTVSKCCLIRGFCKHWNLFLHL